MSTDNITFTLRKNGVDTALTITLTAGSTSATATPATIAVAAGDYLSMKVVQSGTESKTIYMSVFVADS